MKKITCLILLLMTLACSNQKNSYWNDKSELLGTWVKLERDNQGYLVYDPCDGNTDFVRINNNRVVYYFGHEGPDTLKISSVEILNSSNEIEFLAYHERYAMKSVLKIIDFDKQLYLLNWELTPEENPTEKRKGKMMMMTRKEFEAEFRFVDNPCPEGKIAEKEFLPVEYE